MITILNKDIAAEFDDFRLLEKPMSLGLEAAARVRDKFLGDVNLRLHRMLKNFPTGQAIVDQVDVCIKNMEKDKGHMVELDRLTKLVAAWPANEALIQKDGRSVIKPERLDAMKKLTVGIR